MHGWTKSGPLAESKLRGSGNRLGSVLQATGVHEHRVDHRSAPSYVTLRYKKLADFGLIAVAIKRDAFAANNGRTEAGQIQRANDVRVKTFDVCGQQVGRSTQVIGNDAIDINERHLDDAF